MTFCLPTKFTAVKFHQNNPVSSWRALSVLVSWLPKVRTVATQSLWVRFCRKPPDRRWEAAWTPPWDAGPSGCLRSAVAVGLLKSPLAGKSQKKPGDFCSWGAGLLRKTVTKMLLWPICLFWKKWRLILQTREEKMIFSTLSQAAALTEETLRTVPLLSWDLQVAQMHVYQCTQCRQDVLNGRRSLCRGLNPVPTSCS